MRPLLMLAALAAPAVAAVAAQEPSPSPAVERITLQPGESASFTLAPGFDHQLLRRAAPTARGAITLRYEVKGASSTLTATSRAGHPLAFTILADPEGDGGFAAAGEVQLPGDGAPVVKSWPKAMGALNVGGFTGGPHGTHEHPPAGK